MAILKPGSVNLMVADSGVTPVATKQAVAKAIQLSTNKTPVSAASKKSSATTTKAPSSRGGYSGGGGGSYSDPGVNALSLLAQNYNNSVKSVNSKYDAQVNDIKNEAADQLRQAYINYMLNRRNSANDMARQGYTGGMTESNLARLYNNYGTIRNDINRRADEAVNKYNLSRNAELLSLLNNYNNQQLRYAL